VGVGCAGGGEAAGGGGVEGCAGTRGQEGEGQSEGDEEGPAAWEQRGSEEGEEHFCWWGTVGEVR
jgi:hypothetical protein